MQVFLKLPGHAGVSRRAGYLHWLPVHAIHFVRPLLEKEPVEFTIHKAPDALSVVIAERAGSRRRFATVRLHHVEGNQALLRLRFDQVAVHRVLIDGAADEAMERVTFSARRWQIEP